MSAEHPVSKPREVITNDEENIDGETYLDVISDEYTQKIVQLLITQPLSAAEITSKCDMSRCTVYRRLNDLAEIGVISEEQRVCENGHHKKEFKLAKRNINVELNGVVITIKIPEIQYE